MRKHDKGKERDTGFADNEFSRSGLVSVSYRYIDFSALKKEKELFFGMWFYAFFLSIDMISTPTIAITIIMAIAAAIMYVIKSLVVAAFD